MVERQVEFVTMKVMSSDLKMNVLKDYQNLDTSSTRTNIGRVVSAIFLLDVAFELNVSVPTTVLT